MQRDELARLKKLMQKLAEKQNIDPEVRRRSPMSRPETVSVDEREVALRIGRRPNTRRRWPIPPCPGKGTDQTGAKICRKDPD
jgi:hypothetical protein